MCLSLVSVWYGRAISLGFIMLSKYLFFRPPLLKKLLALLCSGKNQRASAGNRCG